MKVMIDIPEEMWEWLHNGFLDEDDGKHAINAILKGTPLPKGHGRLIDADDAKREWRNVIDCEVEHPRYQCTIRDVLEDAPTIIEADKGSEDKK